MQAIVNLYQAVLNKLGDIADYVVDEFQYYGIDISGVSHFFNAHRRELDQDPFDMLRETLAKKVSISDDPLDTLYPPLKLLSRLKPEAPAVESSQSAVRPGQFLDDVSFSHSPGYALGHVDFAAPLAETAFAPNPQRGICQPGATAHPVAHPGASGSNVIYLDKLAMSRSLSQALSQEGYAYPQPDAMQTYRAQYYAPGSASSPWVINGKRPRFHRNAAMSNSWDQAPAPGWVQAGRAPSTKPSHCLSVMSSAPEWQGAVAPASGGKADPKSVKIMLDSYQSLSKSMDSLLDRYFTVSAV